MVTYGFRVNVQDNLSTALNKIGAAGRVAFGKLQENAKAFQQQIGKTSHSIDGLNAELDRLKEMRRVSVDISHIKFANREIQKLEKQMEHLENLGKNNVNWARIGTGIATGAAVAGAAITAFAVDAARTGAGYETQQAVLSNKLGSKDKAAANLQQVGTFANTFGLDEKEARESFVKLSNRGASPTMQKMENWGNIVARTGGKNMDQFAEALLDAQGGEFVRLQEFGIRGKQNTKDGTVTLKDTVSGYTQTLKADSASIMKYLDVVSQQEGTKGILAAKAETTEAGFQRMENAYNRVKVAFASGLQPFSKDLSVSVVNFANIASRYAAPAAKFLAQGVTLVVKGFTGIANAGANAVNWIGQNSTMLKELGVVVGVTGLAYAASSVYVNAYNVGMILLNSYTKLVAFGNYALAAAQWAVNAAMTANPIGIAVVTLGLAAAAITYFWHKSEGFRGFLYGFGDSIKVVFHGIGETISNIVYGAGEAIQGLINGDWEQVKMGGAKLGKGLMSASPIGFVATYGSDIKNAATTGYQRGALAQRTEAAGKGTKGASSIFGTGATPISAGLATDGGGPSSVLGGGDSSSGGSSTDKGDRVGVKNVYISIDKLVERIYNTTSGIDDFEQKLSESVKKVIVQASNDFNLMGA